MTEAEYLDLVQRVVECKDEPVEASPLMAGDNGSTMQALVNAQRAHAKEIKQLKAYINDLRRQSQIADLKVFVKRGDILERLKINHISEDRSETGGKEIRITVQCP